MVNWENIEAGEQELVHSYINTSITYLGCPLLSANGQRLISPSSVSNFALSTFLQYLNDQLIDTIHEKYRGRNTLL